MPSNISNEFATFVSQIGLREEDATALWQADIRTPQELASTDQKRLQEVCNKPLLINFIHPVLMEYVFNISTAANPYRKAIAILKKRAPKDDDDEDMEVTASDSIQSDADPYTGTTPVTGAIPERRSNTTTSSTTTFSNRGSRLNANGLQAVQNAVGDSKPNKKMATSISIHGGNFVQASIMPSGPVTYNNTNTHISTTLVGSESTGMMDLQKLRQMKLNDYLLLGGSRVPLSDIQWTTGDEFWIEPGLSVPKASREMYRKFYRSEEVYKIRNFGKSRALIINNFEFDRHSRMSRRAGADRDGENMEAILKQLEFIVTCVTNRTKDEMKQLLREFAESDENNQADMVAVYIGSHGERDSEGRDAFVGTDGGRIPFDEVKSMFSSASSPYLEGKPKLFFLQFCRKETVPVPAAARLEQASNDVRHDAGPIPDAKPDVRPMDFVCVYATVAGNKAYRDTMDGSWFVTSLVRILKENANTDDLQSMLTKVNNCVSVMKGQEGSSEALQISEVVHNLRRKIYFWPGMA